MRALLHEKSSILDANQKGCLANYCCAGIWTKTRASAAGFLHESVTCELCDASPDSLQHRLWTCPATADLRLQLFTAAEIKEAQGQILEQSVLHEDTAGSYEPYRIGNHGYSTACCL